MNEEEAMGIKLFSALSLWCGFMLMMYPGEPYIKVIAGLSGFLLVVFTIIYMVASEMDKSEPLPDDLVMVEQSGLSELFQTKILMNCLEENGVKDWEGFEDSVKDFNDKIKEMEKSVAK